MTNVVSRGKWYPTLPPLLDGEGDGDYNNRLTDTAGDGYPYDHARGRKCALGWHLTCADLCGGDYCFCPCHFDVEVTPYDPVSVKAVANLGRTYSLPRRTARRIAAHVQRALESGEVESVRDIQRILADIYDSEIHENLAWNTMSFLGYIEIGGKVQKP